MNATVDPSSINNHKQQQQQQHHRSQNPHTPHDPTRRASNPEKERRSSNPEKERRPSNPEKERRSSNPNKTSSAAMATAASSNSSRRPSGGRTKEGGATDHKLTGSNSNNNALPPHRQSNNNIKISNHTINNASSSPVAAPPPSPPKSPRLEQPRRKLETSAPPVPPKSPRSGPTKRRPRNNSSSNHTNKPTAATAAAACALGYGGENHHDDIACPSSPSKGARQHTDSILVPPPPVGAAAINGGYLQQPQLQQQKPLSKRDNRPPNTAAAATKAAATRSPSATGDRVTSTKTAATSTNNTNSARNKNNRVVKGRNGQMVWAIYVDTPGGHAASRLQLVTGVEAWEEEEDDDYGCDDDYNDHDVKGGAQEEVEEDDDINDDDDNGYCQEKKRDNNQQHYIKQNPKALPSPVASNYSSDGSVIKFNLGKSGVSGPAGGAGSARLTKPERAPSLMPQSQQQSPLQQEQQKQPGVAVVPHSHARRQSLEASAYEEDAVPSKPKRQVSSYEDDNIIIGMPQQNVVPRKPTRQLSRQVQHAQQQRSQQQQSQQQQQSVQQQPQQQPTRGVVPQPSSVFIPQAACSREDGLDEDRQTQKEDEDTYDGTLADTLQGSSIIASSMSGTHQSAISSSVLGGAESPMLHRNKQQLSSRQQQQRQQQQNSPQRRGVVPQPSSVFIPRPATNYPDGDQDPDDEGTFADTLQGSSLVSLSQCGTNEAAGLEGSATWEKSDDFSTNDDYDDEHDHEDELEDDIEDDETNDESACQQGYIKNHSYASPSVKSNAKSMSLPKSHQQKSLVLKDNYDEEEDSIVVDPVKGLVRRGNTGLGKPSVASAAKSHSIASTSGSLADIEHSFALDSTAVEEHDDGDTFCYGQSHSPSRSSQYSSRRSFNPNLSQSLCSLPEDRAVDHEDEESSKQTATSIMKLQRLGSMRNIGILGAASSQGGSIRGPRKDSSASAASARSRKKSDTSHTSSPPFQGQSNRMPDHRSVPRLANQFADAFLGSGAPATPSSHNASQSISSDEKQQLQRSMTSHSSESSSSAYSFGIPGLRARSRHEQGDMNPYRIPCMSESTAFLEFNPSDADGVQVVQIGEQSRGTSFPVIPSTAAGHMNQKAKNASSSSPDKNREAANRCYNQDNNMNDDGLSVDEFNAADAMPPLVDLENTAATTTAPEGRKPPSRGLSLRNAANRLQNLPALPKPTLPTGLPAIPKPPMPAKMSSKQNLTDPSPFETPRVNSRRFLRRNGPSGSYREKEPSSSSNPTNSKKTADDLVKRFFAIANSSFGSLASTGEILDDDDNDDDDDNGFDYN